MSRPLYLPNGITIAASSWPSMWHFWLLVVSAVIRRLQRGEALTRLMALAAINLLKRIDDFRILESGNYRFGACRQIELLSKSGNIGHYERTLANECLKATIGEIVEKTLRFLVRLEATLNQ
jgi:hypothetical protein